MYFLPILFLYLPINWGALSQYTKLSLRRLFLSRNAKFTYIIVLILCYAIVRYGTFVHPFILSDNRHYVFYVWRKVLSKEIYRYALCFVYALIVIILGRILLSKRVNIYIFSKKRIDLSINCFIFLYCLIINIKSIN